MKALAGLFGGGGASAPAPKSPAQALAAPGATPTATVAAPASGDAVAGRVTLGVGADDTKRRRAAVPGLGL